MAEIDKLSIVMTFNGKTVRLSDKGETAQPTFKRIMSLFIEDDEITLG